MKTFIIHIEIYNDMRISCINKNVFKASFHNHNTKYIYVKIYSLNSKNLNNLMYITMYIIKIYANIEKSHKLNSAWTINKPIIVVLYMTLYYMSVNLTS